MLINPEIIVIIKVWIIKINPIDNGWFIKISIKDIIKFIINKKVISKDSLK